MQQLYEALGSATQISPWVYLLVAAGGMASGISPCFVPVLAMFGGYVGGYARGSRSAGVRLAIPFIFGNANIGPDWRDGFFCRRLCPTDLYRLPTGSLDSRVDRIGDGVAAIRRLKA